MTTTKNVFHYLTLFDPMVAAMARGANKSTRLRILNSVTSTWRWGGGIKVDNEKATNWCASWAHHPEHPGKNIIIAMSWLNLIPMMWKGRRLKPLLRLYRQAILITRVPSIHWAGFVRIQEAQPTVQCPGYQYKMYNDNQGMDLRYYYSHIKHLKLNCWGCTQTAE